VQQNRFDSILLQSSATHFHAACDLFKILHSVATKSSWRKNFREKIKPYLEKYVFIRWWLYGAISGSYNSTNCVGYAWKNRTV